MNPQPSVTGMIPWLPWPFSSWSWWIEPVRAERLAALRIGVALCLLADIALNYAPLTFTYFGTGGLGDPRLFDWRFQPSRLNWSLLRGVDDGIMVYLSLLLLIASTCWIVGTSIARLLLLKNPPSNDRSGMALIIWTFALLVNIAGFWSRGIAQPDGDAKFAYLDWVVPFVGLSLACLFISLDLASRWRNQIHRIAWPPLLFALFVSLTIMVLGVVITLTDEVDKTAWWLRPLQSWQDDDTLLVAAMGLWLGSAFLLLLGCLTRFVTVLTWLISMSFANANPYLDNAGDVIRAILLFYLMLCPCGAVGSVDAWFKRSSGPTYVHPWPIRLIFVQMILMYFLNGLYKLLGPSWRDGSALHYVLGEMTLTRFSQMMLPLPIELTRVLTWSVVVWEVSFPLLVLMKWPRRVALVFGVLFHVGIVATMELGGFVPYALCMYLPLVPWERLQRSPQEQRSN